MVFLLVVGVGVVDGLLYAVGGHDGPLVRKSVEVYNHDTNSWSQVNDMHLCRRNAGMSRSLGSMTCIYVAETQVWHEVLDNDMHLCRRKAGVARSLRSMTCICVAEMQVCHKVSIYELTTILPLYKV